MSRYRKIKTEEGPSRFYLFDQNNSGGRFHIEDENGIGPRVWVEARSADEANSRAEQIGIYFNGVREDRDCDCCGDRWSSAGGWRGNGKEACEVWAKYDFDWHDTIYLHRLDGTIDRATISNVAEKQNFELRGDDE